jgi:hypothetical protein
MRTTQVPLFQPPSHFPPWCRDHIHVSCARSSRATGRGGAPHYYHAACCTAPHVVATPKPLGANSGWPENVAGERARRLSRAAYGNSYKGRENIFIS